MTDAIICPKCGSVMIPIDPEKPVGMICPSCNWNWVTSYSNPMDEDTTEYVIHVIPCSNLSKAAMRLLADISGKNFLYVHKQSQVGEWSLISGHAREVKEYADRLELLNVPYTILPDFPY